MNRAANANPLATQRASTVPGNRRRAASGNVCTNTSAQPKASMPTGTPLPTGTETNIGTKRAVAKPAATNANALSNTQALVGSRRDPLARSFMT